ncbi:MULTISPECIES: C/D box methylation guide ribonucleoprotein complex aNOP56 subunit [Thermococcus]|nr:MULTISPECIES: C/D box methylation guide ribonucleoprotein complex aNOP56 subunit [Thermococcus]KUK18236.1 MAG: NOP5/NOP56 related protein [Thermococcus sibiricus]KUK28082.1 MAG: NOP5/NOP56 related protein [Thermococcus sp. 40_45]MBC7095074.1 C/D box methylation guide ribonucleoprotein complex aNOP56 subunit [Thermococcus sp.]HII67734.1 C/D box methylation guide ribonucleoprotein complex aNOP56 subunit [Thermococcaceae archaeon]
MKAYISENVQGIYAFDEGGNLIGKRIFTESPEAALDKLLKGEIIDDLLDLLEELKENGYSRFAVEHPELSRKVREAGFDVDVEFPNLAGEKLRENPEEFLGSDWFEKYFKTSINLTRARIQEQSGARDKMIIQAIEALDDIDKVINLLVSRLREWYSLHFPEIDEILPKHPQYVAFIKKIGNRKNITRENLESFGLGENKIARVLEVKEKTMGAWMDQKDITVIQNLAKEIEDLYKLRSEIEDYIERAMDDVAPNLKALVGAKLGARLISLAGGLKELALMPSSTIQVLGAEKALFRHLRSGAKPPKHGIIYQYPAINKSPWWQRGKIARALAGKLAIAARVDYFSGEYIAEELKNEIEIRIKEIKEKYPNPPKRKEKPVKKEKKKKFKKKGKEKKFRGKEKKQKKGGERARRR